MQLPFGFVVPLVTWKPPLTSELPSWADVKRLCIDVETCDPLLDEMGPGVRRGGFICGVGFAIEDGSAFYLPIRHQGGDNMDCAKVLAYLRDQARAFRGVLVGANLNYDLDFLAEEGIEFPNVSWIRDVQVADVICNELFDRYGLDAIAERRGLPGKDETVLREFASAYKVHPKKELWKLPGRAVGAYGVRDVQLPLLILRRQEAQIEEEEIQQIFDLECRVTPILVKMRRRGVKVNLDKILAIRRWATDQAQDRLDQVQHLCGAQVRIDQVWSGAVMAQAITKAGFKVPMTAGSNDGKKKPQPSITGDFLEQCGEIGKALARARDYSKVLQFCKRTLDHQIKGRVHCTFHQLRTTKEDGENKGARYGRTSSEDYNLQQEFGRDDEFSIIWRDIYEPDHGGRWACSDWSQQEPRIGVHYAEFLGLPGAAEFAETYRRNPGLDIHQMLADLSGLPRKIVKNYVNGRLYGMGDAKLCRQLGHPTRWVTKYGKSVEVPGEVGATIINRFTSAVPWLTMLVKCASDQAKKVGHVWTVLRRKCRFPQDGFGNYDWTHKAFSRIGQGGAADQAKATLVAIENEGIPIQMLVHDEFDFTFSDERQARRVRELQMDVVKFNVPMKVDLEVGSSWGRLHKIDAKPDPFEMLPFNLSHGAWLKYVDQSRSMR